jgi:hypothetical protein
MRRLFMISALVAGLCLVLAAATFTDLDPHRASASARPAAYRQVSNWSTTSAARPDGVPVRVRYVGGGKKR